MNGDDIDKENQYFARNKVTDTINGNSDSDSTDDFNEVEDNCEELLDSGPDYLSEESEPEYECDIWDNDCNILSQYTHINSIQGYHLMPTCDRDPNLQVAKRQKIAPELNANLLQSSTIGEFKQKWTASESISNKNFEIISDPFRVCVVHNLLQNKFILDELRQEFYNLDWNIRSMDLYEFFQSKDLRYLKSDIITIIYDFLKDDVMKWVAELTGLELTHISATCSLYSNTDYLLVHDDQREDRLVAFVLYLTGKDGWSKENGGALDLLSRSDDGHPKEVVRSILPSNNQLVFFPVTNCSYHQVAEVTTLSDCRLSINGWFHTKVSPTFKSPLYKPIENGLYSKECLKPKEVDIDLECWINEDYLEKSAIKFIQKHIEENSEMSLKSFFKHESFNEILQMLKDENLQWEKIGPPNRYSYEIANITTLPHSLERFLNLCQSKNMFKLLHNYTDLDLDCESASMKFELQRWTPGCYSLLSDYNWDEKNELDLIMYFGCNKTSDIIGARTQYVTIEDEIQNALITVEPEENNLNIVYRDSARFTKYFSKQSKCKCFYALICSYSE